MQLARELDKLECAQMDMRMEMVDGTWVMESLGSSQPLSGQF